MLVQILLEYQHDVQEWGRIVAGCLQLLEDSEVRVREAISNCTRLLAEQHSAQVVQSMQGPILQSIEHNWVSMPSLLIRQKYQCHRTGLVSMRQAASHLTCPCMGVGNQATNQHAAL